MTPKDIENDLIRLHGYVIGNEELSALLGFRTMSAFRQAISRKKIPVKIFNIENRRGKFAFASDVAEWLFEQRSKAMN